jgi:hypothetical protein
MQPLQGWVSLMPSLPRAALRLPWAMIFNPFGVTVIDAVFTQGGAALALGYDLQPLRGNSY